MFHGTYTWSVSETCVVSCICLLARAIESMLARDNLPVSRVTNEHAYYIA